MSRRPWYKRYPSDFISGTLGLSLEEKGAYSVVLDLIYDRGAPIPDDSRWIARVCGCSTRRWNQIRQRLIDDQKLVVVNGCLTNERAEKQMKTEEKEAEKLAENGAKGAEKRAEKKTRSGKNKHLDEKGPHRGLKPNPDARVQSPPYSPPSGDDDALDDEPKLSIDPEKRFGEFWQEVPRKVGRGQAEKAWRAAIKQADPDTLIAAMRRHAAAMEGREQQFIPHPATWLNGKRWLDEEAQPPQTGNGQAEVVTADPDSQWQMRVKRYREAGMWLEQWGARPDEPFCRAPIHVLQRHGYAQRSGTDG